MLWVAMASSAVITAWLLPVVQNHLERWAQLRDREL